jgi:hypothetical protein
MQMNELIVSKNSHVTQIAIGHDGFFAILKVSKIIFDVKFTVK